MKVAYYQMFLNLVFGRHHPLLSIILALEHHGPNHFASAIEYVGKGSGRHSTGLAYLLPHPAAPGLILGILKNFSLDVAEIC